MKVCLLLLIDCLSLYLLLVTGNENTKYSSIARSYHHIYVDRFRERDVSTVSVSAAMRLSTVRLSYRSCACSSLYRGILSFRLSNTFSHRLFSPILSPPQLPFPTSTSPLPSKMPSLLPLPIPSPHPSLLQSPSLPTPLSPTIPSPPLTSFIRARRGDWLLEQRVSVCWSGTSCTRTVHKYIGYVRTYVREYSHLECYSILYSTDLFSVYCISCFTNVDYCYIKFIKIFFPHFIQFYAH